MTLKPKVPGLAQQRGYNHLPMPPKSFTVCKHMPTFRTAQKTQQGDTWGQSRGRGGGGAGGQFRFLRWGLTPPRPPPPLRIYVINFRQRNEVNACPAAGHYATGCHVAVGVLVVAASLLVSNHHPPEPPPFHSGFIRNYQDIK